MSDETVSLMDLRGCSRIFYFSRLRESKPLLIMDNKTDLNLIYWLMRKFYFETNKPSLIDSGTVEEVIGSVGDEIRAHTGRGWRPSSIPSV